MSVAAATVAKDLQDCAVAWLASGAEFVGVPVIGRRTKTLVSEIEAAVQNLGLCVFVHPGLPLSVKDVPGPYCDRYELRVTVFENPDINSDLPDAYELTEYVVRRLHLQQFDVIPGMNPLISPQSGRIVEPVQADLVAFDIIFETSLGYLPRIEA